MDPIEWLIAAGVVGYSLFMFAAGHLVGYKRATRKHLPALLYAAKRPPRADLGNTVARQPQRPTDEVG